MIEDFLLLLIGVGFPVVMGIFWVTLAVRCMLYEMTKSPKATEPAPIAQPALRLVK